MVDSREKGARAETVVRDLLKKLTGLKWERVPGSGALNVKHGLKGDLYVPNAVNNYAVEVKHYAEDHLTSELLTGKSPTLLDWWSQTIRQAKQLERAPLLIFKHDRSKVFAAYTDMPEGAYRYIVVCTADVEFYVSLLEDWVLHNKPKFVQ